MIDWEEKAREMGFDDPIDMLTTLTTKCSSISEMAMHLKVSRESVYRVLATVGMHVNGREGGLKCPKCGSTKTRVVFSVPTRRGRLRRRLCRECLHRFMTIEEVLE